MPGAKKGVGKGRHVLSPPQHTETNARRAGCIRCSAAQFPPPSLELQKLAQPG